eukprot:3168742-Amphidinium_carterae.1
MRRYCMRKDTRTGARHTLAEDIRMASLEALFPDGLEQHVQLQKARLDSYVKLNEEVVLYAEAGGFTATSLEALPSPKTLDRTIPWTSAGLARPRQRRQRQGERKGSTSKDRQGVNCGKKGHLISKLKDCWSKPQGGKPQQNKGGKDAGGARKGKGKGKSKDAGALEEALGTEPVGAGNLDLCHAAEA